MKRAVRCHFAVKRDPKADLRLISLESKASQRHQSLAIFGVASNKKIACRIRVVHLRAVVWLIRAKGMINAPSQTIKKK